MASYLVMFSVPSEALGLAACALGPNFERAELGNLHRGPLRRSHVLREHPDASLSLQVPLGAVWRPVPDLGLAGLEAFPDALIESFEAFLNAQLARLRLDAGGLFLVGARVRVVTIEVEPYDAEPCDDEDM